jgi:hypothetical protein
MDVTGYDEKQSNIRVSLYLFLFADDADDVEKHATIS